IPADNVFYSWSTRDSFYPLSRNPNIARNRIKQRQQMSSVAEKSRTNRKLSALVLMASAPIRNPNPAIQRAPSVSREYRKH
ncbi:hypothetical protein, partial [Burkholderia multivorans]|uniref:hypothetical protein n=1 Tax=Burkholderia multivorans TaxID=87883 RepID=UPI00286FD621